MEHYSKKRLFMALNLPNELKKNINKGCAVMKHNNTGVRWVKSDIMHLTLHFLGNLDKGLVEHVKEAMKSLEGRFKKIEFITGKINAFPNLERPRVIFLECKQTNGESAHKLQDMLGKELVKIGIKIDSRLWKTHLTLGRVKYNQGLYLNPNCIKTYAFSISTFELMESELKYSGAEYRRKL